MAAAMLWALVADPVACAKDGRPTQPEPSFSRDVLPILRVHCLKCHGSETRKADLDLRSPARMEKGGASGPAIVKGSASSSLLYENVSTYAMPPGKAAKLTDEHIRLIARWIDAGAASDGDVDRSGGPSAPTHWAFRPPVKRGPPAVKEGSLAQTPIDAFVLARLAAKGLTFAPEADRRTLLRRASFDLTGLPPTPEEIDRFLADSTPDAYDRLIDRLLTSPAYGERWGRHWLDNAGYADTHGGDNDLATIKDNKNIWKYRDYVVRSLNADKPFDRFITEQLAGDELVDWRARAHYSPETFDALVATGFLRHVPDDTNEPELNRLMERNDIVGRVTESVATNLLGLTVNCARCHDHKYDPITQEDYFRLLACFTPAYDPGRWKLPGQRTLPDVAPGEALAVRAHNASINRQLEEISKQVVAVRHAAEERLQATRISSLPEPLRADLRGALAAPPDRRTVIQNYLAGKLGPLIQISPADADRALTLAEKTAIKTLTDRSAALAARQRFHGDIQAVWEDGVTSSPTRVLRRGDWAAPLSAVEPGFPAVLCHPGQCNMARPGDTKGASSGRRLALARWLTEGNHPLTARVLVNRIWQHHFGVGIVATPDNFGLKGAPPTNPELLDWLAVDLVEQGWKLKRLHKLIMTSAVFRQSSRRPGPAEPARAETADPANDLLGRMPLRRLEAEAVRDAVLAVSGQLDRRLGGPPTPLVSRPDGLILVDPSRPADASRRSLYLFARRNYPVSLLNAFDFPIMALNCTRRPTTATPLQSLAALNSAFVQDQAASFAVRVRSETEQDAPPAALVERAFLLAFARRPSQVEVRLSVISLEKQAAEYRSDKASPRDAAEKALTGVCHMLFCANEFLYVE